MDDVWKQVEEWKDRYYNECSKTRELEEKIAKLEQDLKIAWNILKMIGAKAG